MARVRNAVLYLIGSKLQSKTYGDLVFFFSGPGSLQLDPQSAFAISAGLTMITVRYWWIVFMCASVVLLTCPQKYLARGKQKCRSG